MLIMTLNPVNSDQIWSMMANVDKTVRVHCIWSYRKTLRAENKNSLANHKNIWDAHSQVSGHGYLGMTGSKLHEQHFAV